MEIIENPKDIDAVIVIDAQGPKMVVPDDLWVSPGQVVQWAVEPPEETVQLFFDSNSGSPFEPQEQELNVKYEGGLFRGRVRRDAIGLYKYSVKAKQKTIDPRLRVK